MPDFPPRPGRRTALAALLAAAAAPRLSAAQDENWPNRPVKLIVPFAPGGPTDTIARMLAEKMQAAWQQPVVVDYKPGGGTITGTNTVAKAPADGYTLGMAISALMINPSMQPSLPYDTRKDLAAVSQVALTHFGLFAHPSLPVDTVPELIAYARKNPGKLSYATPGVGTGTHLAGELLAHMAGIELVHVPYKGSSPAQQDVVGGRVPLLFDVMFSAMPYVEDKRLKLIALASPKRAASHPDIPLIAETVPGFSAMSTIGIVEPAGVPAALRRRVGADIGRIVKAPDLAARMQQLGMEPVGSTPEQYAALIDAEIDKWAKVVKTAGIKIE
ncbi:tripartite tricarboxylate transporter substrate binding protein [Pigmentiphaga sp. GD03639]|jgi:tripartite-type tricarboxylate transporter receptor subunit TctC|uniref:Tripartite tricarboxylate transporter substrate binding protein n=1 Tax=Pigmentiphaga daeguensis TaxID=414049 RepID=A0ABN1BEN9_9BURK|nr:MULTISPECIES: tripartite tricarboxylate transporter substrate binding protein [unclassified Pigmentiphaga]MDH2238281.1 tripartite tricarboxylate transporter substrate binding protein [Pigmentiphaga sp. GD03639]OVZ66183.1 MFS transporter [Pigmentiphaga sp. NML030171]